MTAVGGRGGIVVAIGVVLTVLVAVLPSGEAAAHWPHRPHTPTIPVEVDGVTIVPRLDIDGLHPGASVAQALLLDIRKGDSAHLDVVLQDVRDYENGCLRPEVHDGDTSCTHRAGQGELSQQLHVGMAVGRATQGPSRRVCVVDDEPALVTMADLEGQRLSLGTVQRSDQPCVLVAATLPWEADNRVQSDRATFDLRVELRQVVGGCRPGHHGCGSPPPSAPPPPPPPPPPPSPKLCWPSGHGGLVQLVGSLLARLLGGWIWC